MGFDGEMGQKCLNAGGFFERFSIRFLVVQIVVWKEHTISTAVDVFNNIGLQPINQASSTAFSSIFSTFSSLFFEISAMLFLYFLLFFFLFSVLVKSVLSLCFSFEISTFSELFYGNLSFLCTLDAILRPTLSSTHTTISKKKLCPALHKALRPTLAYPPNTAHKNFQEKLIVYSQHYTQHCAATAPQACLKRLQQASQTSH